MQKEQCMEYCIDYKITSLQTGKATINACLVHVQI